jgi:hypothetical protein
VGSGPRVGAQHRVRALPTSPLYDHLEASVNMPLQPMAFQGSRPSHLHVQGGHVRLAGPCLTEGRYGRVPNDGVAVPCSGRASRSFAGWGRPHRGTSGWCADGDARGLRSARCLVCPLADGSVPDGRPIPNASTWWPTCSPMASSATSRERSACATAMACLSPAGGGAGGDHRGCQPGRVGRCVHSAHSGGWGEDSLESYAHRGWHGGRPGGKADQEVGLPRSPGDGA